MPLSDLIHEKLESLFHADGQLLTMEFPGRILTQSEYLYDTSTTYSESTKPQTVVEAEFDLANEVFEPFQIVGGSSGKTLVESYTRALNNVLPSWAAGNSQFKGDQEKIRQWLLSPASLPMSLYDPKQSWDPSKLPPHSLTAAGDDQADLHGTLVDVHRVLLSSYERALLIWNQSRVKMLSEVEHMQSQMQEQLDTPPANGVTDAHKRAVLDQLKGDIDTRYRQFAMESLSAQELIDGRWSDLVIRGYHHPVREAFSFLDIESVGERVEASKQSMRRTEMMAIDGSHSVYPVTFEPADWAQQLTSSFTPRDLLMDPEMLAVEANDLQRTLDSLYSQQTLMKHFKTGNVKDLQEKVEAQKDVLQKAQSAIVEAYGAAVFTAAKIALKIAFPEASAAEGIAKDAVAAKDALAKLNEAQPKGKSPLSMDDLAVIAQQFDDTVKAQDNLTSASEELANLTDQLASAHASDLREARDSLALQITTTKRRLDEDMLMISLYKGKDASGTPAAAGTDTTPAPEVGSMPPAGPWTQVVMSFNTSNSSQKTSLSSDSKTQNWNFNAWIASGSGSDSSSSSSSSDSFGSDDCTVKMAFEVTKVNMNRGGWFVPDVFQGSNSLRKVDEKVVISPGPPPQGKIPAGGIDPKYIFPVYPVSFIIARDISIVIEMKNEVTQSAKDYLQKQSASSGGFFCFSYSTSASSSATNSSFYHHVDGKNVRIKIPGAQILGWFQKWVPEDKSTKYEPLPESYFPQVK